MKERFEMYVKIVERAENDGLYDGDKQTLLMDIESADKVFNLRLNDWLKADAFNFAHDLYGIMHNVKRDTFPATNFGLFVPRFAGSNN